MCDYVGKEVPNEDYSVAIYIKEEVTIEESHNLNGDINQEPKLGQCSLSNHEGHESCNDSCGQGFKEHLISYNNEIDTKCDQCDKTFNNKEDLTCHIKNVHATGQTFQCKECSMSFTTASFLQVHVWTHSEQRLYKCDQCPKTYKTAYILTCHKAQEHGTGGNFSCQICGKMYLTSYKLKQHMVRHNDERNFQCDVCNSRFKCQKNLNGHMKYVHATVKPFVCQTCRKTFSTAAFLQMHVSTHNEERPFKCDQCHKTFKRQYTLSDHKAREHSTGGKFSCEVCGKMYTTMLTLKLHMVKHSNELHFECDECHKRFKSKVILAKHKIYSHPVQEPFQCEVCLKKFAKDYLLRKHAVNHSEIRPFKCYLCSKAFKFKNNRNRHITKVHNMKGVEAVDDVKVGPIMIYDPKENQVVLDSDVYTKDKIKAENEPEDTTQVEESPCKVELVQN